MSAVVSPLISATCSAKAEQALKQKARPAGEGTFGMTAFDVGPAHCDPRDHAPGTKNQTMCK
jgi:hypothetical protein